MIIQKFKSIINIIISVTIKFVRSFISKEGTDLYMGLKSRIQNLPPFTRLNVIVKVRHNQLNKWIFGCIEVRTCVIHLWISNLVRCGHSVEITSVLLQSHIWTRRKWRSPLLGTGYCWRHWWLSAILIEGVGWIWFAGSTNTGTCRSVLGKAMVARSSGH